MGSKTISVNDDVYRELKEIKEENESFSELFHRLITIHHQNLEKSFGSWQLTKEEEEEIWKPLLKRPSRKWMHLSGDELR